MVIKKMSSFQKSMALQDTNSVPLLSVRHICQSGSDYLFVIFAKVNDQFLYGICLVRPKALKGL